MNIKEFKAEERRLNSNADYVNPLSIESSTFECMECPTKMTVGIDKMVLFETEPFCLPCAMHVMAKEALSPRVRQAVEEYTGVKFPIAPDEEEDAPPIPEAHR